MSCSTASLPTNSLSTASLFFSVFDGGFAGVVGTDVVVVTDGVEGLVGDVVAMGVEGTIGLETELRLAGDSAIVLDSLQCAGSYSKMFKFLQLIGINLFCSHSVRRVIQLLEDSSFDVAVRSATPRRSNHGIRDCCPGVDFGVLLCYHSGGCRTVGETEEVLQLVVLSTATKFSIR